MVAFSSTGFFSSIMQTGMPLTMSTTSGRRFSSPNTISNCFNKTKYVCFRRILSIKVYVSHLEGFASVKWLIVVTFMADKFMDGSCRQIVVCLVGVVQIRDNLAIVLFRKIPLGILRLQIRAKVWLIESIGDESPVSSEPGVYFHPASKSICTKTSSYSFS